MSENREKKPLSPEVILERAKESGIELSDEQLERISGGWDINDNYDFCENCGSMLIFPPTLEYAYCSNCGHVNGPYETE